MIKETTQIEVWCKSTFIFGKCLKIDHSTYLFVYFYGSVNQDPESTIAVNKPRHFTQSNSKIALNSKTRTCDQILSII